jgi:hypothetical protein
MPPVLPPPPVIPPPPSPPSRPSLGRRLAVLVLNAFLGLFLTASVVSVLDDSCVLFLRSQALTMLSELLSSLAFLATILAYGLTGLTPMMPKRFVWPLAFVSMAAILGMMPVTIYHYQQVMRYDLAVSALEAGIVLAMFFWLRAGHGNFRFWATDQDLGPRVFSWRNLGFFVALNLLLLAPLSALYVAECASLAVSHLTDGFVALRPAGLVLQARRYTRSDGKTILLFPMSHIAESSFYQSVAQSVSSNSVVLLEGVTDNKHLLAHHITYERAAKSLHLAEQHEDFKLDQGVLLPADVDVSVFSTNTISLLNVVMLMHAEGVNPHTLSLLMSYAPSPDVEQELINDLLLKRNQHVLNVLFERLPEANSFVIPWGAAHMAGLASAIQKAGFHLVESRDYVSIRFGHDPAAKPGSPKASAAP